MRAPAERDQPRKPRGVPGAGEWSETAAGPAGYGLDGGPQGGAGLAEGAGAHQVSARELTYIDPRSNSDKFYRVYVSGNEVSAQYGRNGTAGTWTAPKSYPTPQAARKAADKTVAGKAAKGYNLVGEGVLDFAAEPTASDLDTAAGRLPAPGQAPAPLRAQSAAVAAANAGTDIDPAALPRVIAALEASGARRAAGPAPAMGPRPMLAEIVDPALLAGRLADDGWVAQPKLDGERVLIEIRDGQASVLNRQGQPKARNVSEAMVAPFRALTSGRWVFDGEVVGRTLHLFDMPAAGDFHDERAPYSARAAALAATLGALDIDPAAIRPVETAAGGPAKRAMLAEAVAKHREGIILRHTAGAYESGRRAPVLLKHKLHSELDAEIVEIGEGGKDNAVLAVRRADGTRHIVGRVSTIGKGDLKVGDVVEARFLYTVDSENPTLVQPRIMRKRTGEKSAAECSIDQLAHSKTDKSVG